MRNLIAKAMPSGKIQRLRGFFGIQAPCANQLGWALYDLRVASLAGNVSRGAKSGNMLP
jgi:hypothetical protein